MSDDVTAKVQRIFQEVFDEPELLVDANSTAADVPGWDSFTHVSLVYALESDFQVSFGLGELQRLKNVGQLIEVIRQRLGNRS